MWFREIVKKLNISILEKIEENVDKLKFFNFKYMGKTYQFIRRSRDELFLFTLDTNNGEDEIVIDILSPSKIFPLVKEWNDKFPIALEIGDFEYLCDYDEMDISGIIISPHHQNQVRSIDELKKNSDRIHYMIGKLHGRKLFFFREGINENLVIIYERTDKFYNEIDDAEKVQEIFNTLDDKSEFLQVSYLEFYTEEEIKRDLDEKRRYWLSKIKNNLNSIKRIYIEHTDNVFFFEREKNGQSYVLICGENMRSAESRIEYDEGIMIELLTKTMMNLPLDATITIKYRDSKETIDINDENNNESLTSYSYNTISEKINKGILKKIIWEEGERVFTAVKVDCDDNNTFGLYEINCGTLFEEPVSFLAYDRESLLKLLDIHMMSNRFKLFSVEVCEKSD